MRCSKARDYLSRDLDGMLPPDATAGLRDHVDACEACRSFREDLVLGRRLMAASEPRLPDNFDWKLQLRLNQALQQRAGETAYPWQEDAPARRGGWLPAFGAASSVGLAAVLAVAVFLGPQPQPAVPVDSSGSRPVATMIAGPTGGAATSLAGAGSVAGRGDRRSIFTSQPGAGLYGGGIKRSVSQGGAAAPANGAFDRGWSGMRLEDLQTIQQLRASNEQLQLRVYQYQLELRHLKAQLDTAGGRHLDTDSSR